MDSLHKLAFKVSSTHILRRTNTAISSSKFRRISRIQPFEEVIQVIEEIISTNLKTVGFLAQVLRPMGSIPLEAGAGTSRIYSGQRVVAVGDAAKMI